MRKNIFINNPAATLGGGLVILVQLLNSITTKFLDKKLFYWVFCSSKELKKYEKENIKIINNIKAKKWKDRLKWNLYGLKLWSQKNKIKADLIVSLENLAPCYFRDTKIIVYLQQALPFFEKIRWNLLKREERLMWFYQKIYPFFIKESIRRAHFIIVQTEWMKKAVIKKFKVKDNKILKIFPSVPNINIDNISKIDFKDNKFHIFYPAAPYVYKNHHLIIKSASYIKQNYPFIYNNLLIHFTFWPEDALRLKELTAKLGVEDIIKFEGNLEYQSVLMFYKSVNLLVFPSYIESFPLPLVEAPLFGLPILVSDLNFSREILNNYKGAQFLDYQDFKLWGEKIVESYNQNLHYPSFNFQNKPSWEELLLLIENLLKSN